MKPWRPTIALLMATAGGLLLAACERPGPAQSPAGVPTTSATADTVPPASDWLGKWNGPEGTYLDIQGDNGSYTVTIRNLDGAREFPAKDVGGGIGFERNGVAEVIRATDGDATGMKWLAGKSRCLTIQPGEGYCRD